MDNAVVLPVTAWAIFLMVPPVVLIRRYAAGDFSGIADRVAMVIGDVVPGNPGVVQQELRSSQ
jgi:hypothetical protein